MTAEAASNVVVPLRPIDGPEHPLARGTTGRTGMLSGFDPDLTVMRDWPHRMAVVVGQALHPNVVQALSREGFHPVITSVDRAAEVVRALSPVSVFVLGPDVFDSDASVDAVRSWRRASPAARVKLVYSAENRSPEVLVRAIRAGVTDVVDVEDAPGLDAFAARRDRRGRHGARAGARHRRASRRRRDRLRRDAARPPPPRRPHLHPDPEPRRGRRATEARVHEAAAHRRRDRRAAAVRRPARHARSTTGIDTIRLIESVVRDRRPDRRLRPLRARQPPGPPRRQHRDAQRDPRRAAGVRLPVAVGDQRLPAHAVRRRRRRRAPQGRGAADVRLAGRAHLPRARDGRSPARATGRATSAPTPATPSRSRSSARSASCGSSSSRRPATSVTRPRHGARPHRRPPGVEASADER